MLLKLNRRKEVETVIHSDNDFATVAFLRIKKAVLEPKSSSVSLDIRVPLLLDEPFIRVRDAVLESQSNSATSDLVRAEPAQSHEVVKSNTKRLDSWVAVTNVQSESRDQSVEEEVTACFHILRGILRRVYLCYSTEIAVDRLAKYSLELSNCTNINIFLSSIDLFAQVNAVYATFFGTSPPARACVAVDLPSPVRVKLDCLAYVESLPTDRQALHVQGLSYWAPANIGPYSQAIVV